MKQSRRNFIRGLSSGIVGAAAVVVTPVKPPDERGARLADLEQDVIRWQNICSFHQDYAGYWYDRYIESQDILSDVVVEREYWKESARWWEDSTWRILNRANEAEGHAADLAVQVAYWQEQYEQAHSASSAA